MTKLLDMGKKQTSQIPNILRYAERVHERWGIRALQMQENKKKQLQEEAKKAIAEKEEANAEVEAAKTEVADLWKEHDYLTSANRTKVERSNWLDLDIRTKTNRSQSLDCTIEAKKQEGGKLSAKADKKLRDFYTIKERGNWQDPMFFAHCFL